jgi:N-acylglucosamine 2-epimerase (GlcNAc 2-epimerase)
MAAIRKACRRRCRAGQNPQMHVFEALIASFDATHDAAFQSRAGELFGLFVANLYDGQNKALGEYFEQDWSRIEPVRVEPATRRNGSGCSRALSASPAARPGDTAGNYWPRRCATAIPPQGCCWTRAMPTATSENPPGAAGPDRDRQSVDRAGRSRTGRRRRRGTRGAATPAPALPDAPGDGRLVRPARRTRSLACRYHSSIVVLSYPLRDCGSRPGLGLKPGAMSR